MTPDELDPDLLDAVRFVVYDALATTGAAPPRSRLEAIAGGSTRLDAALRALHDAHALVLNEDGSIRMALPFSAIPTDHEVVATDGRRWWANCAWDALAIPSLVGRDAQITSRWLDDGSPLTLTVTAEGTQPDRGLVHFLVPACRWWDDIVET